MNQTKITQDPQETIKRLEATIKDRELEIHKMKAELTLVRHDLRNAFDLLDETARGLNLFAGRFRHRTLHTIKNA